MGILRKLHNYLVPPGFAKRPPAACSFCLQEYDAKSRPLVQGQRGAFICDACIDASRVVMDEEKRRRAMTPPGLVCQMCGALNAADAKQCVGVVTSR